MRLRSSCALSGSLLRLPDCFIDFLGPLNHVEGRRRISACTGRASGHPAPHGKYRAKGDGAASIAPLVEGNIGERAQVKRFDFLGEKSADDDYPLVGDAVEGLLPAHCISDETTENEV